VNPKWKTCAFCNERKDFMFEIVYWTQHCFPSLQYAVTICDNCLEQNRINPDYLIQAIAPEHPEPAGKS